MSVTGLWYGKAMLSAFNKEIDLDTDTLKCTLHSSVYTPDQDTHQYQSSLTNELGTANGYTAGGATLTTKTVTYTGATNVFMFDCDDPVWTASGTLTARTAVFADTQSGVAASNPLLCYQQSSVDVSATDAEFRVQIAAAGLFTITVS